MKKIATIVVSTLSVSWGIPDSYYSSSHEGWYAYEKEAMRHDNNKTKPPKPNYTKMTAQEFKHHLDEIKEEAVVNPTIENVKYYIELQNYAMAQSQKFQNIYRIATLQDGELNIGTKSPSSMFSRGVDSTIKENRRQAFYRNYHGRLGFLVYFDSSQDMEKFDAQKRVAQDFEDREGIKTLFIDIAKNPQMRQQLKIGDTPDIWLMIRSKDGNPRTTFKHRVATGISDKATILEAVDFVSQYVIESGNIQ